MNRKLIAPVAVVAVAAVLTLAFADETKPESSAAMCPVMDEQIDPSVKIATDDGPLYFCCTGCIEKYKKEPAKYAEKVTAQREALADVPKVQVTCPLSNEPIDPNVSTENKGQTVHFCCPKCKGKFEADPEQYSAALANSFTIQTTCPMSGDPIDPKEFVDTTNGQRIYFCGPKCPAEFTADPAKMKDKLAEQHIAVDPTTVKPKS